MAPPFSSRTLKPLSLGGLWLAVILAAPNACRSVTPNEMIGVGMPPPQKWTGMPLAASNLGCRRGEILRPEALVAADHHAAARFRRVNRLQVIGKPLRGAAHIVEREVLGDASTPAVGAEVNVGHAMCSVLRSAIPYCVVRNACVSKAPNDGQRNTKYALRLPNVRCMIPHLPQRSDIGVDHDAHKLVEGDGRLPVELATGFGRIADEQIDLGGPIEFRIDHDVLLPIQVDVAERDSSQNRAPSASRRSRPRNHPGGRAGASATWRARNRRA